MEEPFNIPLSKPDITQKEIDAVTEVLKTSQLSLGQKYKDFQEKIAAYAGVKYAVATNSGTSALHLIIKALGIGKGDEVITTPFSFIASSNCILYENATPVFVDIDEKTLNIDVTKIEEKITPKTKAILAVDVFSHPADWEKLEEIAKKHDLFLIEDSAEALGSEYKGRKCGTFGDVAIFSFYPNKQITTGEGGVIVTNNEAIADLCQSMVNQGRKVLGGQWLEHLRLGYNYRLDEMSAALGVVQMERVEEILSKRKQVANWYHEALAGVEGVQAPYVADGAELSWFVYVVVLSEQFAGEKRDEIMKKMIEKGIKCRDYFQPIHLQPFYKETFNYKEGDFPVSENIGKRTIALPFFNDLTKEEVEVVVETLKHELI